MSWLVAELIRDPRTPNDQQRQNVAPDTSRPEFSGELGCLAFGLPTRTLDEPTDVVARGPLGLDRVNPAGADDHMIDVALGERNVVKHRPAMVEFGEFGRRPQLGLGSHGPVPQSQRHIENVSEQRQDAEHDADEQPRQKR